MEEYHYETQDWFHTGSETYSFCSIIHFECEQTKHTSNRAFLSCICNFPASSNRSPSPFRDYRNSAESVSLPLPAISPMPTERRPSAKRQHVKEGDLEPTMTPTAAFMKPRGVQRCCRCVENGGDQKSGNLLRLRKLTVVSKSS